MPPHPLYPSACLHGVTGQEGAQLHGLHSTSALEGNGWSWQAEGGLGTGQGHQGGQDQQAWRVQVY